MYSNVLYSPSKKAIIDITLTVVYFAFVVPRYVSTTRTFGHIVGDSDSWLQVLARDCNGAGLVMLGFYGTNTTMVNLCECPILI